MQLRRKLRTLVLTTLVPGAVACSCASTAIRETRDAMINGAATFVEEATFQLLDQLINPGGTTE